jgi:DNA-binding MarR family transcriptional regulator
VKCFCATTRRAARLLSRYYEDCLRPAGLTPAQFELMETLGRRPELSQVALAEALCLDQTTLSRNLKILIAREWVSTSLSPTDKRQARYGVTAAGKEVWRLAVPHWRAAQEHVERSLGSDWPAVMERLELTTSA